MTIKESHTRFYYNEIEIIVEITLTRKYIVVTIRLLLKQQKRGSKYGIKDRY